VSLDRAGSANFQWPPQSETRKARVRVTPVGSTVTADVALSTAASAGRPGGRAGRAPRTRDSKTAFGVLGNLNRASDRFSCRGRGRRGTGGTAAGAAVMPVMLPGPGRAPGTVTAAASQASESRSAPGPLAARTSPLAGRVRDAAALSHRRRLSP
jgi:hypothetical protein